MIVIGHRGAPAHAPENTLASFALALTQGAQGVECDIHCVDNRLIVLHDNTVDRTTDGSGPLDDWAFDALRTLDAGGGERIPTVDNVLDLCHRRATVHVELKGAGTDPILAALLAERRAAGMDDDIVVSSFDHDALRRFAAAAPAVRIAALFGNPCPDPVPTALALGAWAIHPHQASVTADMVDRAHHRGLAVNVWTVNDPETALRLRQWGVDAVITDDPKKILQALGNRTPHGV